MLGPHHTHESPRAGEESPTGIGAKLFGDVHPVSHTQRLKTLHFTGAMEPAGSSAQMDTGRKGASSAAIPLQ
jgi:hypothetical protein